MDTYISTILHLTNANQALSKIKKSIYLYRFEWERLRKTLNGYSACGANKIKNV